MDGVKIVRGREYASREAGELCEGQEAKSEKRGMVGDACRRDAGLERKPMKRTAKVLAYKLSGHVSALCPSRPSVVGMEQRITNPLREVHEGALATAKPQEVDNHCQRRAYKVNL